MQDIAFISSIVDGDAWAAIKYRKALGDNPYTTKIQLFEASRVCNPNTYSLIGALNEVEVRNPKNGNRIINGVEINTDGAVVAYWVADRVPYDPTENRNIKWVRVEAFGRKTGAPNILQISHEERPEQYRGVPILAPAIEELKQMHRYSTAELTAAIIKSYFTLFFKTQDAGEGLPNALPEAFGENEKVAFDQYTFELGAGTMNELPPGYEVQTVDANRSLSTFEAFVNALIAQVGAALEIPSEVLCRASKARTVLHAVPCCSFRQLPRSGAFGSQGIFVSRYMNAGWLRRWLLVAFKRLAILVTLCCVRHGAARPGMARLWACLTR